MHMKRNDARENPTGMTTTRKGLDAKREETVVGVNNVIYVK